MYPGTPGQTGAGGRTPFCCTRWVWAAHIPGCETERRNPRGSFPVRVIIIMLTCRLCCSLSVSASARWSYVSVVSQQIERRADRRVHLFPVKPDMKEIHRNAKQCRSSPKNKCLGAKLFVSKCSPAKILEIDNFLNLRCLGSLVIFLRLILAVVGSQQN